MIVGVAALVSLAAALSASAGFAASITRSPLPTGSLGITPGTPDSTDLDLQRVKESGSTTIRYGLPWASIQDRRGGPFDWSDADRFVLRASRVGLSLDLLVSTTPSWASSSSDPSIWDNPLATAVGREGWAAYVRAAVRRYGRGGTFWAAHPTLSYRPVVWTVWNEPNLIRFWSQGPHAGQFAQLMNFTGPIIRNVDPTATVIAGGVFCQYGWQNFLANFYQRADKSSFDDVAIHPYNNSPYGSYGLMLQARQIMDRAGDRSAGIWVDEISWGTDQTKDRFVTSLQQQAENLRILFQILAYQRLSLQLDMVMWYGLRDDPDVTLCQFCASSGLWNANGLTPKPAWFVFKGFGSGAAGEIRGEVSTGDGKPAAGQHLYLDLNADGKRELGEPQRPTTADGTFSFPSLYPTTYEVRLVPPPGQRCLSPTDCTQTVQVQAGQVARSSSFSLPAPAVVAAPDTKITKKRVKSKKRKARFDFKGKGGKSPLEFTCKLDRRHWKPCTSPKKYKHLKRGKHKFKVRAEGANGKVDKTPARERFAIKR